MKSEPGDVIGVGRSSLTGGVWKELGCCDDSGVCSVQTSSSALISSKVTSVSGSIDCKLKAVLALVALALVALALVALALVALALVALVALVALALVHLLLLISMLLNFCQKLEGIRRDLEDTWII